MTQTIPIFINDRCFRIPAGMSLGEALAEHEPGLFSDLLGGQLHLTDGRSIVIGADVVPAPGSIFRARRSARLGGSADA